jgi:hypothetical protein
MGTHTPQSVQDNVQQTVQRSFRVSSRWISARLGIPQTRVWRMMHEEDLYPYNVSRTQHLEQTNCALRLNFCRWHHAHAELCSCTLFTDEETFTHDGENKYYNTH